jgi:hypothetical protein
MHLEMVAARATSLLLRLLLYVNVRLTVLVIRSMHSSWLRLRLPVGELRKI